MHGLGGAHAPIAGLVVVGLGASLAAMDLAVNVAFPSITAAFALDSTEIRWLIVCYVLTYASLMLAFGRLGDSIGHRRVFRAGLLVGVAAYALCALAQEYAWLLLARIVQGVSTALLLSCAPALATLLFDDIHRTRALSAYASLSAVASIVAPVAGGISIAILGWAGVFWFRVPIAILALALLPFVPSLRAAPEDGLEVRGQALIGSTLLAGGLAAALLAFPLATSAQTRMLALPAGLLGACGLAVFALHQRRARTALLPRPLLYDIDLVLANGASVIVSFAAFAVPLLVPYYLERIAGLSPLAAGIALACSPVGILAGSMAAAGVVRKIGAARALLAGALAVAIGQLAIAVWGLAPPFALMVFSLAGQGAGWGLFQVAYTDVAVAALSRRDRGVAGSIAMLTRTIGVITAAALLTALLASTEARHLVAGEAADAAFVQAFATVFVTTSVLVATFLGVQLLRRRRAR